MKRTFEHGGPPAQWIEIECEDTAVRLHGGTRGRLPKSLVRPFPNRRAALAFVEQQAAAHLAKGYVETTPVVAADAAAPAAVTVERHQRFEWKHEAGRPFTEITQEGRTITVRRGRVVGDRDVPDPERLFVHGYESVAKASAVYDERCADARYAGAVAIHDETPVFKIHANAELEQQCEEAPDDPAPWAIYADWLIAHADPRGEIAALHLAGKPDEALRVLRGQVRDLCGSEEGAIALDFRHGFAVGATIKASSEDGELLEDVTRAFLASPMARFVDALRFGLAAYAGDNDWAPTLQLVCESPRGPFIRALRFDAYTSEDSEISWTPYGDFAFAWPRLPALELLHIKSGAGGTLGQLVLPKLKTFIRESGGLARAEIDAIAHATWPALEHLEIWFGAANYGAEGDLGAIRPILDGEGLPALRHLGIVNCELVDDVVADLPHRPILRQLRTLDLSKGVLAGRGAASLVANAAAYRHLAWIDLDANVLQPDEVAAITAALPNVRAGTQRERDDDDAERYVAVGE